MTSPHDLVDLTTASSAFEAEWLVGALKGHGIPAVTVGGDLADEFAMSQKLMHLGGGVRVLVSRASLEQAREALAEIEAVRPTPAEIEAMVEQAGGEEEAARPAPASRPGDNGKTLAIVMLGAAVIALGWLYLSLQHETWERPVPLHEATRRSDGWAYRWRQSGKLDSIYLDRDQNNIHEEVWFHARDGILFLKMYDGNQNGTFERTVLVDPDGVVRRRDFDTDENGMHELVTYPPVDGVQERWFDADEDARFERQEFVRLSDGKVLDAFEDRGREGYVRVP